MKSNRKPSDCTLGRLPAQAPLANPYVPFQRENPSRYEAPYGLIRGTLYPGLDLPFRGRANTRELTATPMTRLQALSFAIQELALYLDTHREDREALAVYREYQKMYDGLSRQYQAAVGPLNHMTWEDRPDYGWTNDPWPWEYSNNKGV